MKKIVAFILIMSLSVSTMIPMQVFADDVVKVYIDGEMIDFDVNPEIINGRTMVPMRRIFEYLGADVKWYDYDRSIYANCGYLDIQMQIDNYEMSVDEKLINLDVAPIIENGRTLVPLRAVAEAFSAKVEWVDETQSVEIETQYPKNNYISDNEFDSKHIRTSYGDYEYFDFLISNNKLIITGCTSDNRIKNIEVEIDNSETWEETAVTTGKEFIINIDLEAEGISNGSFVNIWTQKNGDEMFVSYINEILYIQKNGDEYSFQKPLVWENNKNFMSEWINPIGYIKKDVDNEIINLSNNICENATNNYEKILKIHDWVADNIYYFDYYDISSDISYDALSVYKDKRSVCEGYSNLTQALMHAQNIPCRKVSGYSLGMGSEYRYWTNETAAIDNSNHAWVQAYVNNRWVNIDTTWDSGNKYENGQFLYEGIQGHFYFDISNVFLSYNHKYLT